MKIEGGCHCGAVRFEAQVEENPQLVDCNCSVCSMTGFLHLFVAHENFTLTHGEDSLTSYRFGTGKAQHLFCKHCGIKSFYQPRSHPDSWSVNLHCVQKGDQLRPEIITFDGRNWDENTEKPSFITDD